jgi:hypothetical protein
MAQYEDKLERRRLTFHCKPGEWPWFKRMFTACMDEVCLSDATKNKYAPDGAIITVAGVADPDEPVTFRTRRATKQLRELEEGDGFAAQPAAQQAAAQARVDAEATTAANEDRRKVNHKLSGVREFDGFEAWKALKNAYQQPTEIRLTTLHQELMTQQLGAKLVAKARELVPDPLPTRLWTGHTPPTAKIWRRR